MKIARDNNQSSVMEKILDWIKKRKKIIIPSAAGVTVLAVALAVVLTHGGKVGPLSTDGQLTGNEQETNQNLAVLQEDNARSKKVELLKSAGVDVSGDLKESMTPEEQEQVILQAIEKNNQKVVEQFNRMASMELDVEKTKAQIVQQVNDLYDFVVVDDFGWVQDYEESGLDTSYQTSGDASEWNYRNRLAIVNMMKTGVYDGYFEPQDTLEQVAAQIRYSAWYRYQFSWNHMRDYTEFYDILYYWFKQGMPVIQEVDTLILTENQPRLLYDDFLRSSVHATIIQDDGTVYEADLAAYSGYTLHDGTNYPEGVYLICDFWQSGTDGNVLDYQNVVTQLNDEQKVEENGQGSESKTTNDESGSSASSTDGSGTVESGEDKENSGEEALGSLKEV